jgi:hypothetical protein
MKKSVILNSLLCFLFVGCWNALNRGDLKRDVAELLSKAKVSNVNLDCHTVGSTRNGICDGKLPSAAIADIASALKLTEVVKFDPMDYQYETWIKNGTCSLPNAPTVRNFKSMRRAPELHLKNGGNFEYFVLHYDSSTGQACIRVSYSYG